MSIQRKSTEKVELVETHNMALSLRRLNDIPNSWNNEPTRRALYHAICMTCSFNNEERGSIRQSLKLP